MAEILDAASGGGSAELPKMSFVQRMIGIYFEPKRTFEDIHRRGSWIGLVLLVSALVMTGYYLVVTRMDTQTLIRKGLEQSPFTKNMPEERIQQILSRPVSPLQLYLQVVLAPVGVMVSYLLVAGVLLLIFILMGASLTYKKSLSVTIWGMSTPLIILLLLGIFFVMIKDPDSLELNVVNNVVSNPGITVAEKEHPVLHGLLASLDPFSFWTIYLLAVGFSAVSSVRLTTSRAAMGVLMAWGIYVSGKLGVLALFG